MDWRDSEVLDLMALFQAEARLKGSGSQYSGELELRKAQYDSILENMKEYVERSGPDYALLYVNEAREDLYGCATGGDKGRTPCYEAVG